MASSIVEKTLQKEKSFSSKEQLWNKLSEQISYGAFLKILDDLAEFGKIIHDKNDALVWIAADNPKLKKLIHEATRFR